MTPLELCEPIFTKICVLNRLGRQQGGSLTYDQLRSEIEHLLAGIRSSAEEDPALKVQWQKLELPMNFFVDSMISESGLAAASTWNRNRLAYEQKELAGDEKFFDLLDETLNDPSDEASQRLVVFYTCLGLGFTGWYAGQPEYLRGKMLDVSQRIRSAMETDKTIRICPETYLNVDTRDLVQAPASKLGGIAIVFAGLCLIVVTVEAYLFHAASLSLTDSLTAIGSQEISK
jgi:type IV/VI secretion system ImpK/VasF family protein